MEVWYKFTCCPRFFGWTLAHLFPVKFKKPVTERQEQVEINGSFLSVKENVIMSQRSRKVSAHAGCRTRALALIQPVLVGFITTVAHSIHASAGPEHPTQARDYAGGFLFPLMYFLQHHVSSLHHHQALHVHAKYRNRVFRRFCYELWARSAVCIYFPIRPNSFILKLWCLNSP